LINVEDDQLLQLGNGKFYFNWRRRERTYPRYQQLFSEFKRHFGAFRDFLTGVGPMNITRFELTYLNHLDGGDDWDFPENLDKALPLLGAIKEYSPTLDGLAVGFVRHLPKDWGTLTARLNMAQRVVDLKRVAVLDFRTHGLPDGNPLEHFERWFGIAHNSIIETFEAMTSRDAKSKLWGGSKNA
jgi:uncharacterized protein (TIGR04255 family)